jgi:hypothetical protein
MCEMSDREFQRCLRNGKGCLAQYKNIASYVPYQSKTLPYYFYIFFGNNWRSRVDMSRPYIDEHWDLYTIMDRIVSSTLPLQQKKNILEELMNSIISGGYNKELTLNSFNRWDFSVETRASDMKNPILYFFFVTRASHILGTKSLLRIHASRHPGEPDGQDLYLRYKDEMIRRLNVVYRHITKSHHVEEVVKVCNDLTKYALDGVVSHRVAPYVRYLLYPEKTGEIDVQAVEPQRYFCLTDLYDTSLELTEENEKEEEVAAEKGEFAGVENRIERAATADLPPKRQKILSNAFGAAAKQSVDDLVFLRELVQNVLDEVTDGEAGAEFQINTYRTKEGDSEYTVIETKDTIGMNAERLYNKLLMPFSSSKDDPAKYLGKQGQGFFTLLVNSEYVVIKTIRDGNVRIVRITPQRINGSIVDFFVAEETREALPDEADGTHMQAVMPYALAELETARVESATRRFAGLVNENKVAIKVNGNQINVHNKDRLVVEDTPYGELEFYSIPGESFLALGGLYVKPLDDKLLSMIPGVLRGFLIEHGIAVNLPHKHIRRIQGGSDIAERDRVYGDITDIFMFGVLKLAISMFTRGDVASINELVGDYHKLHRDSDVQKDISSIVFGPANVDYIRDKYLSSENTNRLVKLLLSIPLECVKDIFNEPISVIDILERFRSDPSFFTESIRRQLPPFIKEALLEIEARSESERTQAEEAVKLGVPEELAEMAFIPLSEEQGKGMGAYWAFLEMSNAAVRIIIDMIDRENIGRDLGLSEVRLKALQDSYPSSTYYAQANGLSAAHALQGGGWLAWNLLEQRNNLHMFSLYMRGQIPLAEFLDKAFEDIVSIVSHELTHICEESSEVSHNKVFYVRQKLLASALIGGRGRVEKMLENIVKDERYKNNIEDVPITEFLRYVASMLPKITIGVEGAVISGDESTPADSTEGAMHEEEEKPGQPPVDEGGFPVQKILDGEEFFGTMIKTFREAHSMRGKEEKYDEAWGCLTEELAVLLNDPPPGGEVQAFMSYLKREDRDLYTHVNAAVESRWHALAVQKLRDDLDLGEATEPELADFVTRQVQTADAFTAESVEDQDAVASISLREEAIRNRIAAEIEAYESYDTKGDVTITLIGEPEEGFFAKIIRRINRLLGRKGRGIRGVRQLETYTVYTKGSLKRNEEKTRKSRQKAIRNALKELKRLNDPRVRVVDFVPQIEDRVELAQEAQTEYTKPEYGGKWIAVGDAYSDIKCPDIHARDALARLIACHENMPEDSQPATFRTITTYIKKLSGLDVHNITGDAGINNLEDLLDYLAISPLRIAYIWETIEQMEESYKAVERAL